MKRILLLLFIVSLTFLAFTLEKPDKVDVYEVDERSMVMEESLVSFTDPRIVHDFVEGFNKAQKNEDPVNSHPNYLIGIKDDYFFLWISEDYGIIMDTDDTKAYYSLSKSSARAIYNLLGGQ